MIRATYCTVESVKHLVKHPLRFSLIFLLLSFQMSVCEELFFLTANLHICTAIWSSLVTESTASNGFPLHKWIIVSFHFKEICKQTCGLQLCVPAIWMNCSKIYRPLEPSLSYSVIVFKQLHDGEFGAKKS